MQKSGKLELTWVGKYDTKVIEPRIFVEDFENLMETQTLKIC